MSTLLEINGLYTSFGRDETEIKAVREVSLKIEKGETHALGGESGSGKSVTALSVMQLLPYPVAWHGGGSIRFRGDELMGAPARRMREIRGNRIAMIFQEPLNSLNPLHSIEKQISEVLHLHKALSPAEAHDRVLEMLDLVGLPEAKDRLGALPHEFSGGQQQRVMIAMALANDPDLLIADEPTTALDVTIQAQILELMKDLTKRLGASLIIITHNLGVVARYADRVNVMYAGRIIEMGTAQDIYHNPRHPYTLALLKSVPRMDLPRQDKLDPIEGQPPDLTRLDGGCSFRPRCRYAKDSCAHSFPELEAVDEGHFVACFEKDGLKERDDLKEKETVAS